MPSDWAYSMSSQRVAEPLTFCRLLCDMLKFGSTDSIPVKISKHLESASSLISLRFRNTSCVISAAPFDSQIHTIDVVGPEMALTLKGGTPNSSEQVQLWVYLRLVRHAEWRTRCAAGSGARFGSVVPEFCY